MEVVLSSVMESNVISVGIMKGEMENNAFIITPCKTRGADLKENVYTTPEVKIVRTDPVEVIEGPEAEAEAEAEKLVPRQPEVLSKPPLIRNVLGLRELEMKLSEAGNVSSTKMEIASTKLLPVKTVVAAVLKEMPFRERNREEGKRMIPPHIKVPPKKLFGYPERYKSPTDAMVSPISKGLLARNRRPARTLAPVVPPKALENTFQDVMVEGEMAGKSE